MNTRTRQPISVDARKELMNRKNRAQQALRRLHLAGYSPHDISHELKERISWRTLYRWMNAERNPKRRSDVLALEELADRLCKK